MSSPTEKIIKTPWTVWQAADLNRFQLAELMHPFTCPNDAREHDGVDVALMAVPEGWRCPVRGCDYTQDWAHTFMADPFFLSEYRSHLDRWRS